MGQEWELTGGAARTLRKLRLWPMTVVVTQDNEVMGLVERVWVDESEET